MSKHSKLTNLVLSAVTSKRRTPPVGVALTIALPHEAAVKYATEISEQLIATAQKIASEQQPAIATEPATEPTDLTALVQTTGDQPAQINVQE